MAAAHRQGLQKVHSDRVNDACPNLSVLPAIERWHKALKGGASPGNAAVAGEDARRLVEGYVAHYNNFRLNSAAAYITANDMLAGRQAEIHAQRDRKLEQARKQRGICSQKPRDERRARVQIAGQWIISGLSTTEDQLGK